MRKLKLQMQVSLDGFVAGENGALDGMVWNWDDAINNYVKELTESVDCVVLGRKLAQGFIPHWAAVAADPAHPEVAAGEFFASVAKVVFTKTLETSEWEHTELAKGDIVAEINKLKAREGKDIIAYGGAEFVSALIKHNLVDEYHVFVNPVILGKGLSIFNETNEPRSMKLSKAIPFSCGIVVLQYAPQVP